MSIRLICIGLVDASQMIGVSRVTMYRYVNADTFQSIRSGPYAMIPLHEIADYLNLTMKQAIGLTQQYGISLWQVWMEGVRHEASM